jgi:hypothetical protein
MSMPESAWRQQRIGNPDGTVPESLAGSDFFSARKPGKGSARPLMERIAAGPAG